MISTKRVYAMLGNAPLWMTAQQCHSLLTEAQIPHAVVGGVAVCLHGYQRNTTDLDVLVRGSDADAIRIVLEQAGLEWNEDLHEFRSPSGVPVQFLFAGDRAGASSPVYLPDPGDPSTIVEREGLSVVTLARLIETKLACGGANLRRTHKDYADVVELIAANRLTTAFARFLHKSLRKDYRVLVRHASAEG